VPTANQNSCQPHKDFIKISIPKTLKCGKGELAKLVLTPQNF